MKHIDEACLETVDIDKRIELDEIVTILGAEKLKKNLSAILPCKFYITSDTEIRVLGEIIEGPIEKIGIAPELEDIGYLVVEAGFLKIGNQVMPMLLHLIDGARRYKLASSLHIQAKRDDYQALLEKHKALQVSECKYKQLSQELEIRVEKQVKIIDNSQRQLYQAEKLASVGQLAAGVAHELNTPLGFVTSNLNAVNDYWSSIEGLVDKIEQSSNAESLITYMKQEDFDFLLEDFPDLVNESLEGLKTVTQIVSNLRAFSNVDHSEIDNLDINECIQQVVNITHSSLAHKPSIEFNLSPLPQLRCHPAAIGQLLLNLLQNSADVVCDETGVIRFKTLLEADNIIIHVQDNGPGIPQNLITKVFDPFFTTHQVGEGTGLGLTVCKDIMRAHHGDIDIQLPRSGGTLVKLIFPVSGI